MPEGESTSTQPSNPPLFPPRQLAGDRLSLSVETRALGSMGAAFAGGVILGIAHGGKMAALRFRAENSHRFPTTSTGWYLYHKSKNYNVMFAGLKEGAKLGLRLPGWAFGFIFIEDAIDTRRGTKDFMSTVVAGLTLSGLFSLWNRFNIPTAARTARAGLYTGLAYGLLQDAMALARGRRLNYIDFLMGKNKNGIVVAE
ncbi:MAG: hypothetical protein Q9181_004485 [Wetmoreana brouardii]